MIGFLQAEKARAEVCAKCPTWIQRAGWKQKVCPFPVRLSPCFRLHHGAVPARAGWWGLVGFLTNEGNRRGTLSTGGGCSAWGTRLELVRHPDRAQRQPFCSPDRPPLPSPSSQRGGCQNATGTVALTARESALVPSG